MIPRRGPCNFNSKLYRQGTVTHGVYVKIIMEVFIITYFFINH
jgi:hypothetical protein